MISRPAFIAMFIALCACPTFAQIDDPPARMTDSSHAIVFGIGSYLDVQAFDWKGISYEFHLGSLRAIRLGVKVTGYTNSTYYTTERYAGDSLIYENSQTNTRSSAFLLEFTGEHLWYFDTRSDFFVYLGAGPEVRYSNGSSQGAGKSWWAGVVGSAGAEWFASDRFSLHAEYQMAGLYKSSTSRGWSTYQSDPDRIDQFSESTTTGWSIASGTVNFGLSVYF